MTPREQQEDLDRRYRRILDGADVSVSGPVEVWLALQPDIKEQYIAVIAEIEDLRSRHPELFAKLVFMYQQVKSVCRRPTADDLVDFAYSNNLSLAGEPTTHAQWKDPGSNHPLGRELKNAPAGV